MVDMNTRPTSSVRRSIVCGIVLTSALASIAGCTGHAPGELGRLQEVLRSCPGDQKLQAYMLADGTESAYGADIIDAYLGSIQSEAERVSVCGGTLSVSAFGGNSITSEIFSGDLTAPGSTDMSRLRRVEDILSQTMEQIEQNYVPAIERLPQGGTDVVGLLRIIEEAQEANPDGQLVATVLSDGQSNAGVNIDPAMTPNDAAALADQVPVPDLSGASLSYLGIGRTVGAPLSSSYIDTLKAFYVRLCENTKAEKCVVATDDGR